MHIRSPGSTPVPGARRQPAGERLPGGRLRPAAPRALLAAALALAAVSAGALGGCGAGNGGPPTATLMLDFTPNAVHAGIYSALRHGFDRQAGVRLRVQQPAASTDSIKLLLAHRIDFAILDIHDLALADASGGGLVGIMAVVQRPLAAVIAQPWVATPRELQGRLVGVAGDPSDEAVLDSVLAGARANPHRVRRVDVGFQAVPSLLSGRVAAATAFWDVEGVQLSRQRPGIHEFRVDEYGAPRYPELVLCTTRAELRTRPRLAAAVVDALVRGYELTVRDPAQSIADMLAEVPGLDSSALREQLAALHGAFTGPAGGAPGGGAPGGAATGGAVTGRGASGNGAPGSGVGELDMATLRAWAAWEARFGIVARPPDVAADFDPAYARAAQPAGAGAR